MKYTIDANEKSLGRIASQAAVLLMGKNDPSFEKNKVSSNKVEIINASKTKMSPKKMKSVTHQTYSGYPGGQKTKTIQEIISKKGHEEIYRLAVYGMLPANKLRPLMMKNLTVTD